MELTIHTQPYSHKRICISSRIWIYFRPALRTNWHPVFAFPGGAAAWALVEKRKPSGPVGFPATGLERRDPVPEPPARLLKSGGAKAPNRSLNRPPLRFQPVKKVAFKAKRCPFICPDERGPWHRKIPRCPRRWRSGRGGTTRPWWRSQNSRCRRGAADAKSYGSTPSREFGGWGGPADGVGSGEAPNRASASGPTGSSGCQGNHAVRRDCSATTSLK